MHIENISSGSRRVLLVQPPIHEESLVLGTMEPIALETIAALAPADCQVKILDMRVDSKLDTELYKFKPDVVGITGMTIDFPGAIEALKTVRRISPKTITVVGGHHASVRQEEYFLPEVDFIVRGPGSRAFPELLKGLFSGADFDFSTIAGLAYRSGDRFVPADSYAAFVPLKKLPLPRRDLVARYRKKYSFAGLRTGLVTTSQGCPNRCSFCACWVALNGRYTVRPVDDVVKDIKSISEKYIYFGDDNTFANTKRAYHLYEAIRTAGLKKKYDAYARTDTIVRQPELFMKWASIGLSALTTGYEAFDDEALERYNKNGTVETNRKANEILLRCGISNYAHFLLHPDFTEADFEKLADFIHRAGISYPSFTVLTPLPGTKLHRDATRIHPDFHQYYDLCHPLLPLRLPVRDFYKNLRNLYRSCYSYKRFCAAAARRSVHYLSKKYTDAPEKLAGPDLLTVVATRHMLLRRFNESNISPFLAHAEKEI